MRNLKFTVSALAILLAGAMAAGFAARAVAAPRTGEMMNAGVVSVPSVLGQTAEEALFYPWSLYEMQTLVPIPDEVLKTQTLPTGDMLFAVAAFDALGVECSAEELVKSQLWNGSDTPERKGSELIFLKDFPATLADGGVPVSLDYALCDMNPLSVSWLVRPRTQAELTERQRQAALDQVREDLAGLLRYMRSWDEGYKNDLMRLIEDFSNRFDDMDMTIFLEWLESLVNTLHSQYSSEELPGPVPYDPAVVSGSSPDLPEQDLSALSLEELLNLGFDVDVQLISTPRQVVVLFSWPGFWTFGIYYDVQLERYSGFGLSSQ